MVPGEALLRLRRLIDAHDLHSTIPVPIRQLVWDRGWVLRFRERIYPFYGYAIVAGPAKVMTINASTHPYWQRYVMGHEIGHDNNGDLGSFDVVRDNQLHIHQKQERAADIVAAHLLIPDFALVEYETIQQVAAACQVPPSLVRLRLNARIDLYHQDQTLLSAWG